MTELYYIRFFGSSAPALLFQLYLLLFLASPYRFAFILNLFLFRINLSNTNGTFD